MMGEWTVVTDENGVAEFEVEYDDYIATISKGGYATTSLDVPFREDANTFTVIVRKYPLLNIHVVNEMNEPLERAYVVVSTSLDDRQDGWTDSDGNVSFARDYGTFNVAMSKSGYDITRTTVTFDSEHTEFTIVMVKESGHILTINLRNPDGSGAEGVAFGLRAESGMYYESVADENGTCKFDIPHDTYTIEFNEIGYVPVKGTISYTEDKSTFTINLQYALTFHTRDNETGNTITDVLVNVKDKESGKEYTERTDSRGLTSMDVPAGDYHVTFSKNGYQTLEIDFAYDADKRMVYEKDMEPAPDRVVLRIIALDENEEPLSGASVKLKN